MMDGYLTPLKDAELVLLARQGNQAAFEKLVERCQPTALRIAESLSPTRQAAEDLVQDALLEAFLSLDRLRDPERLKSWLFGILLNLGRARMRRRAQFIEEELDPEAVYQAFDRMPGPELVAEERELHRSVLAAVADLPESQRASVWMFYFQALSLQEIAAIMGTPVSTVKVRLHRARHSLRQKLTARYPGFRTTQEPPPRSEVMIRVKIADVIKYQEKTVVMLLSEDGVHVLPIWIGEFEGASIVMGVMGFHPPRPMTFDFISNLLTISNTVLEEVRISALRNPVFYGTVRLRVGDEVKEVDARPSDVLALAARTGAPIFVSPEVMAEVGKSVRPGAPFPAEPQTAFELPAPTGEGMQAILKEIKTILSPGAPAE
jgi:RNA polymerase sigma factor (sigma-70 family)